ncbi:DDE-type integrase/transposase/recombinase [Clostridium sp.]|uniref:DDE-type integrase/transposase/recombinase n=1 Tax=Clostridium sp. TaxID=1506 RepID=UPI0032180A06
MNKTNVKCPRCHSDQLYKFGMDKQANQKYQCKKCKRQFAPDSVSTKPKLNYPRCPKCDRATYLHHEYKHYNRYKCGNKKCNHVIAQYHNTKIDPASSECITGSLSMKDMRFSQNTILTALTLYFLNNSSTRAISQLLLVTQNIKVSHVTIASWTNKFAPFFKIKADKLKENLDLESDDWHADETVIFINGERYYLWLAIDSETRFILAFYLIKSRSVESAFTLINQAAKLLTNTQHIPVKPMSNDITNNLISLFIFHYNYIRPHGSLNRCTPVEVDTSNKKSWFVAASHSNNIFD